MILNYTGASTKGLYDQGKLKPPKTHFWETKRAEELYDLDKDPDEVNNLAESRDYEAIRNGMRKAQQDMAVDICDVGFLPEGEIHSRSKVPVLRNNLAVRPRPVLGDIHGGVRREPQVLTTR